MEKYEFHYDAGHGWLKVSRQELISLGISAKVSDFSYQRGDYAYLEEDCDAPLFLEAKKIKGEKVEVRDINDGNESRIRNYESYKGGE